MIFDLIFIKSYFLLHLSDIFVSFLFFPFELLFTLEDHFVLFCEIHIVLIGHLQLLFVLIIFRFVLCDPLSHLL